VIEGQIVTYSRFGLISRITGSKAQAALGLTYYVYRFVY
jgi:hypothetical protein